MKTVISLPDAVLREAEATARGLGLSRSALTRTALEEFLARQREQATTAALNRSLEKCPDEVDPLVQHFALETLKRVEWKE